MKKIFTLVIAIAAVVFTSFAQGTWIQKADFGGAEGDRIAGFSIGSKGYIGTGSNYSSYAKDLWEYDPIIDVWTQKADFGGTARYGAVGFSVGGKGYIGTGRCTDGYNLYYGNDFWEYDPVTNTWTQKADFGGTARLAAVGFSIGDKGYIGTGFAPAYKKDFWEYDPATDAWIQKADFGGAARFDAVGFSIGDKGYVGTGVAFDNKKDFWVYDPLTDGWTKKTDFGGIERQAAVGFSIGSKGYIGTGWGGYNFTNDFWEYDPVSNSWTPVANFEGAARYEGVAFSIGGKAYIGTGYSFDGTSHLYNDFWEYTPDSSSCITFTATITSLGNLDICTAGFVILQASSGNGSTYRWNRNQVDISGATNQVFKAKKPGNYRVRISNGQECHAVSKKTVVYSSCKLVEEDELISSLNLYPNPTAGVFTLDLKIDDEENSQAIIQVLNMLGQVVYDETTSVANGVLQKEIQLSDAAAQGMYMVKVTVNDEVFSSQINYQK